MKHFVTTLLFVAVYSASVTNALFWKEYKESEEENAMKAADKAMLVELLGPSVIVHKWANTCEKGIAKLGSALGISSSSSSDAAVAGILFSISDTLGIAYACATRQRVISMQLRGVAKEEIVDITHFFSAESIGKATKAMDRATTTFESKGHSFWIKPSHQLRGENSSQELLAIMETNYGVSVVREQTCHGDERFNVTVSALCMSEPESYSFEVDSDRTPINRKSEGILVNYFGPWNVSQIEMDRNVSAYFADKERGSKDEKVRKLLNFLKDSYQEKMEAQDASRSDVKGGIVTQGGRYKVALHKVWRVGEDRDGEIPAVAMCAISSDPPRSDVSESYFVIELRLSAKYGENYPDAYKVVTNRPIDKAGASEKAAQLLSYPDSIARDEQAQLPATNTTTTTTHQIKGGDQ